MPNPSLEHYKKSVKAKLARLTQLEKLNKRLFLTSKNILAKLDKTELTEVRDKAIFESMGEGLVVTDQTGRILIANQLAKKLLGLRKKKLSGQNADLLFNLEDEQGRVLPKEKHPLHLAIVSGKKKSSTLFLKHKNGRLPIAIIATPLTLKGKIIGAVKIFRDASKELAVDKAKTEFVSLASHQLGTPLTIIKWSASRLLDNWGKGTMSADEEKDYLEEIYNTNQRITELVNAILNVSKIELGTLAIEPEPLHLEDLVDAVIKEVHFQTAQKNLHIQKAYAPALPSVRADSKLMWIVFQNLLTNAIKYTPVNGQITCSIKMQKGFVQVCIADTGCGIRKPDQDKIFTKFFRTDAARNIDPNGNGLGMYIVKAIIDAAGGKIWFTSIENKGTNFYVKIPLKGKPKKGATKDLVTSNY